MISKLINRSIQQLHGWTNYCNAKMEKALGKRIVNQRWHGDVLLKRKTKEISIKTTL